MIKRVKRKKLDVEKYDACITNSIQSNIYGYSWYLDIVADNWDVLVLNDYEAVMPIPWKKKFFIKYVYTPLWFVQLGLYSVEVEDENEFLIELLSEFKFVEIRMNTYNSFPMFNGYEKKRPLQIIDLEQDYKTIVSKFRKNRRRDLSKVKKKDLTEHWGDNPKKLIELHKANVGRRIKKINEKDYEKLLRLTELCIENKKGEILSIYDKENKLVASGLFLKHKKRITRLLSSSDFKNRNNGSNTMLIERALYKYHPNYTVFDFAGSSMKTIARFNKSFGTETTWYSVIRYNNLPKLLKFFKR